MSKRDFYIASKFKIQDMEYWAQQLNLYSELHFVPSWSYTINHQLNPNLRNDLYDNFFSKLNMSINLLNTQSFDDRPNKSGSVHKIANFILLRIIIFGCITIVFWLKFKKCRKGYIESNNTLENVERNMHSIGSKEIRDNGLSLNPRTKCNDNKVVLTLK